MSGFAEPTLCRKGEEQEGGKEAGGKSLSSTSEAVYDTRTHRPGVTCWLGDMSIYLSRAQLGGVLNKQTP
jgi:hypothetical protein